MSNEHLYRGQWWVMRWAAGKRAAGAPCSTCSAHNRAPTTAFCGARNGLSDRSDWRRSRIQAAVAPRPSRQQPAAALRRGSCRGHMNGGSRCTADRLDAPRQTRRPLWSTSSRTGRWSSLRLLHGQTGHAGWHSGERPAQRRRRCTHRVRAQARPPQGPPRETIASPAKAVSRPAKS